MLIPEIGWNPSEMAILKRGKDFLAN